MTSVGRFLTIRGDLYCTDDVIIEGRIEGSLWCEGVAVTLSASAVLIGDLIGRDITVFGSVTGTLVATDVVDLRPSAKVSGRIVSARLILHDGASFNGRAAPQQLEAALRVARHRRSTPISMAATSA